MSVKAKLLTNNGIYATSFSFGCQGRILSLGVQIIQSLSLWCIGDKCELCWYMWNEILVSICSILPHTMQCCYNSIAIVRHHPAYYVTLSMIAWISLHMCIPSDGCVRMQISSEITMLTLRVIKLGLRALTCTHTLNTFYEHLCILQSSVLYFLSLKFFATLCLYLIYWL